MSQFGMSQPAGNPNQITIQYLNNDGGGFAENVQIPLGMQVVDFCRNRVQNLANYTILVNGQSVPAEYQLQPNDRVSVTPKKVAGARS